MAAPRSVTGELLVYVHCVCLYVCVCACVCVCVCGRLVALSEEVLLKVSKCHSLSSITTLNLHGNGLIRLKHLALLPALVHLTISFNDLTKLDELAGLVRIDL